MSDDEEFDQIARRESRDRIRRIVASLRARPKADWRDVYRNAHTLASIAPDAHLASQARALADLVCDERGQIHPPVDERDVHRIVDALSTRLDGPGHA